MPPCRIRQLINVHRVPDGLRGGEGQKGTRKGELQTRKIGGMEGGKSEQMIEVEWKDERKEMNKRKEKEV